VRTRFDEFSKDLVGAVMKLGGPVVEEHHIVGPGLDIDVWFRPDAERLSALAHAGLLGRIATLGPCMVEPYRNTPGIPEMRTCLCKQDILYHECVVEARREKTRQPEFPRLWIISSGRPDTLLEQFHFAPMPGWPAGCYTSIVPIDARHIIVARELPRTRETLLLRLLGRGPTFKHAVSDLLALPPDAWERQTAEPLLLAFRLEPTQDPGDSEMQEFMIETQRILAEWEQRLRREGREDGLRAGKEDAFRAGERAMVARMLTRRFGTLSPETIARLEAADTALLETWALRVSEASTLEDVFAE